MNFTEIETKYSAANISLGAFMSKASDLIPIHEVTYEVDAAGYDHYFVSKTDPDQFIRYRHTDKACGRSRLRELTLKRKTSAANNNVRVEVNLPVQGELETVVKFCNELGYEFNFKIWKDCWIRVYKKYTLVYYVVYEDDTEVKRFIEIEMSETYPWVDKHHAWSELRKIEASLAPLGIKPKNRLKKSLFEMYRK